MRVRLLFLLLACAMPPTSAAAADADPFAGVRFLVGEWEGVTKPGEGSGHFTLLPELGGKVLVRRNTAEVPSRADAKKWDHHEDLLVIYPSGAPLKADYWDNEGHVIHYTVTSAPDKATFDSNPGPGPRFQLSYAKNAAGDLDIVFAIGAPDGPLKPFLKGLARKRLTGK